MMPRRDARALAGNQGGSAESSGQLHHTLSTHHTIKEFVHVLGSGRPWVPPTVRGRLSRREARRLYLRQARLAAGRGGKGGGA